MSCNLITIVQGQKMARVVASREEYLKLRNHPAQLDWLRMARAGKKKAKLQLLQFNYSAHYPSSKVKGNRLISNAFMFDIDDVETFERVREDLIANAEKYGLLMLERSCNNGCHAVFKRTKGRTILEEQVRIATELKCEMDSNAHDINRVVFATSADETDLLYLSDELFADKYDPKEVQAESLLIADRESEGLEVLPEGAHKANKHYKPWECGVAKQALKAEVRVQEETEKPKEVEGTSNETLPMVSADGMPLMTEDGLTITDNYRGIPYAEIIQAYWDCHNGGETPKEGDRNTLIYELAYNLRHICGFSVRWLDYVIPCYDNFSYDEKLRTIESAVNARKTSMTKNLRMALELVKKKHDFAPEIVQALDDAMEDDFTYYADKLPELPMGLSDSINAVGPQLAMPAIFSACPAIGALATRVKLVVHGYANNLNLITYVAGDFASGKGSMDTIVNQWMEHVRDTDKMYLAQEEDFVRKKRLAKNKKDQPEEPRNPIRFLTLNNTVANLAERLANTDGQHAFSFTPEADSVAMKWKNAMSDFSVMLRQSYDGSSFEREAKSVDAVRVHIEHLLWNVVMCGTPDALYRVVSNYTDGFLSRIAIARTPDNTFAPLTEKPYMLTPEMAQHIRMIAHVLPMFEGVIQLNKLEEVGREWLEKVRFESMKNDDRVLARGRIRTCITAQRMTACVVLCATAQKLIEENQMSGTEEMLKMHPHAWVPIAEKIGEDENVLRVFDIFADYMLENCMLYFHDKMEDAFSSVNYTGSSKQTRQTKNKTIFSALGDSFCTDEAIMMAYKMKGSKTTRHSVIQMLYNWKKQGLVEEVDASIYHKVKK